MYSCGGDNNGYMWDLEFQKSIFRFSFHSNYLHTILQTPNGEIITAGEDGIIVLWDVRTKEPSRKFKNKKMKTIRNGFLLLQLMINQFGWFLGEEIII